MRVVIPNESVRRDQTVADKCLLSMYEGSDVWMLYIAVSTTMSIMCCLSDTTSAIISLRSYFK